MHGSTVKITNYVTYYFHYKKQKHNIYHNIFLYNIYCYMFRHICVIVREFYICALASYINS